MNMEGKNIVVVGLGKSGIASARYCAERGARVIATDKKQEGELHDALKMLQGLPITYSLGRNDPEVFMKADAVLISPGVPHDLPGLSGAKASGIDVIGEMELAVQRIDRPIVAVTGTNGKTTTAALLGHILSAAGIRPCVAGNIGTPILEVLDLANGSDVVVLEVSSFQIETTPSLKPKIAVWLNATPDHLDRHSTFEEYVSCKAKLFEGTDETSFGIYNACDDVVAQAVMTSRCRLMPFDATGRMFSLKDRKEGRAWYGDGDLWVHAPSGLKNRYPLERVVLHGTHNRENMLAALFAAELCGADSEGLMAGLESFKGLPHRMEFVGEHRGVRYYNDSKGTNVGATLRALEECAEPIVLIAGGVSKDADFSPLNQLIASRVKRVILIGESSDTMEREWKSLAPMSRCCSMEEAVRCAAKAAEPGDVVLLSPACASFDMFKDYADRGRAFVEAVKAVMREM